MRSAVRSWDLYLAVVIAALGGYYLPQFALREITTELIAFFSIQSAVILPAMIFTAGILKPDGLDLDDAERYHKALSLQMRFWVVLLGFDFVAVMALIAGKALDWSIVVSIPGSEIAQDIGWLIPAVLYFAGSLAIFRTIPFVRGVISLLDLNSSMTQKAIVRRNKLEAVGRMSEGPMTTPEGYGKIIDSDK